MPDEDDFDQIKINGSFSAAYQVSKRREHMSKKTVRAALQTIKQRQQKQNQETGQSSASEEEEDEDQDGELLTPKIDRQIMQTIEKIRRRDPDVYNSAAKFYDIDDEVDKSGDYDERHGSKVVMEKKKPKISKSVRQILIEQMTNDAVNPETDDDAPHYVPFNEQSRARLAFINATTGGDSNDDLDLVPKQHSLQSESADYGAFVAAQERATKQAPVSERLSLSRYERQGLSAEDQFLKEYILGEWWKQDRPAGYVDRGVIKAMQPEQVIVEEEDPTNLSDDEAFLEEQDGFEASYNFRFQEPGGTQLVTHPRQIDDSARRTDDRRAKRREKRKASKQAAKKRQIEELKQAKNQRKKELFEQAEKEELCKLEETRVQLAQERLKTIQGIAGIDFGCNDQRAALLSQLDMDDEFDPVEYDRKMASVFDNTFYDQDETAEAIFLTHSEESEIKQDGCQEIRSNLKTRTKVSTEATSKILDELYAMDFEDTIAGGDLRARFRYTDVPPHSFGMSVDEILNTDDKELQRRISIKQLAPYRTDRNLKQTWKQLKSSQTARFRRKQSRSGQQPESQTNAS